MVVAGKSTCVCMTNVSFQDCPLVVLDGASVTLVDTKFTWQPGAKDSISIFASDKRTSVTLQRCVVQGGCQGTTVRNGASMHAVEFQCQRVAEMGLESHGWGSRLRLTHCAVQQVCTCYRSDSAASGEGSGNHSSSPERHATCSCRALYRAQGAGISIQGNSMVWGDEVHVEGARKGVLVSDAHVHFENSSFVNCSHTCCEVMSLYSAEFINCQFTRARYAGLSFMEQRTIEGEHTQHIVCLLYTSPSPRDRTRSRMPSSA